MLLDPPTLRHRPRAPQPIARVATRSLWLAHHPGAAHLEVRGADGLLELEVRLGPEGATLRLTRDRVEIDAGRALVLRADEVAIAARRTLSIAGAEGVQVEGRRVGVRATRGDVAIAANDDVHVDGERIWLNR